MTIRKYIPHYQHDHQEKNLALMREHFREILEVFVAAEPCDEPCVVVLFDEEDPAGNQFGEIVRSNLGPGGFTGQRYGLVCTRVSNLEKAFRFDGPSPFTAAVEGALNVAIVANGGVTVRCPVELPKGINPLGGPGGFN